MKAAVNSQYGEILVSRVIGKLPTSAVSILCLLFNGRFIQNC
jgi:hypothetical protein